MYQVIFLNFFGYVFRACIFFGCDLRHSYSSLELTAGNVLLKVLVYCSIFNL